MSKCVPKKTFPELSKLSCGKVPLVAEPVKSGAFLLISNEAWKLNPIPSYSRTGEGRFGVLGGSGGRTHNEPGDLNQVLWPQPPQEIERRVLRTLLYRRSRDSRLQGWDAARESPYPKNL